MELCYPSYYSEFCCIAGDCPDSCCHEWDVEVDAASAARFRALPGPVGSDLREAMYEEDGSIYLRNQDGRCPMWRQDGLCRIQAEYGHDALCRVCQQFPRLTQDYGSFVELGLEMSCPEAARIMLTCPEWTLIREQAEGGDEPDYDPEVMEVLQGTRDSALEILRKDLPVNERLALLLMYGYHVQSVIDGGGELDFDAGASLAAAREFAGEGDRAQFGAFFGELEILTQRWRDQLAQLREPRWEETACRFAQYGVYRYYYQAVSDWDLVGRIKLIVAGCVLTAMLPGDPVAGIQLYAKEIENSAENLDAIVDGAYTNRALTDQNLLGLLLKK